MAVPKYTVTYTDGRTEEVARKVSALLAAERKWPGTPPAIESTLFIIWQSAGCPGGTFDHWVEAVEDWDRVEGGDTVPPSEPPDAPSPD